jgi:hypothetical protein
MAPPANTSTARFYVVMLDQPTQLQIVSHTLNCDRFRLLSKMAFPSPTAKYNSTPMSVTDPTRADLSAAGKVILIKGAGTGIGAAVAKAFATAGAKDIFLTGRGLSLLEETKKNVWISFSRDVSACNTGIC